MIPALLLLTALLAAALAAAFVLARVEREARVQVAARDGRIAELMAQALAFEELLQDERDHTLELARRAIAG